MVVYMIINMVINMIKNWLGALFLYLLSQCQ